MSDMVCFEASGLVYGQKDGKEVIVFVVTKNDKTIQSPMSWKYARRLGEQMITMSKALEQVEKEDK